ncbi:hypothetical protein FHETE_1835 [Fusarium heterosporum]|uniref:Uncharacterized protein n=1 Tax=Fusarium heterosporum TaxID=42747 RepID=A0A8H5TXK1_FUSHE|nr:hypothetical protein FHETE_1835 [Fusarium heterosporum]
MTTVAESLDMGGILQTPARQAKKNATVGWVRQFRAGVAVAVFIFSIWWSVRSRVCPSKECSMLLGTTVPVSSACVVWTIIMNVSVVLVRWKRSHVHMAHNTVIELVFAVVTTVGFALHLNHLRNHTAWHRESAIAMIALLGVLALFNYFLAFATPYKSWKPSPGSTIFST